MEEDKKEMLRSSNRILFKKANKKYSPHNINFHTPLNTFKVPKYREHKMNFTTMEKATNLTGKWIGSLEGLPLRLAFNFKKNEEGILGGTIDSIDQGVEGIPMKVTADEGMIKVEIESLSASFNGKLKKEKITEKNEFNIPIQNEKELIEGEFSQSGFNFKLVLKMMESLDEIKPINRSQTPIKPFPYHEEEISFVNENYTFNGTLSRPFTQSELLNYNNGNNINDNNNNNVENNNNKNELKKEDLITSDLNQFPVAIMITGSGLHDRDETIFAHKPFLVISDHLVRNTKIAILRVDDRGYRSMDEKIKKSIFTTNDFKRDVIAAVNYLSGRKDIDQKNIGLIGHSEGAIIASMVASSPFYQTFDPLIEPLTINNDNNNKNIIKDENNNLNLNLNDINNKEKDNSEGEEIKLKNEIKFVVMMGGPARKGLDIVASQQRKIMELSGMDEKTIEMNTKFNSELFEEVCLVNDENERTEKLNQLKEKYLNDPNTLKDIREIIEKDLFGPVSSRWYRYFLKLSPELYLKNIRCPVLSIIGEKDSQVIPSLNVDLMKEYLEKNNNATVEILPNLNHLFQECNTGNFDEYATIDQTFNPDALNRISTWINTLFTSK